MTPNAYTWMDDETLRECEDLISAELTALTGINSQIEKALPQIAQDLIASRIDELFKHWTAAMIQIEKRNLSPIDTGEV